MNQLRLGTIKHAASPTTVKTDGSDTAIPVSYLVGASTVTLGQRVLVTTVDGIVVAFSYTDVS